MKRPRNVGLYSWRKVRKDNAITFSAGILVGAVFSFLAIVIAMNSVDLARLERERYGSSESHTNEWIVAIFLLVVGVFLAHSG